MIQHTIQQNIDDYAISILFSPSTVLVLFHQILQVLRMSASTRSNASVITRTGVGMSHRLWTVGSVPPTAGQDATALQYFMWRFSDHSCWAAIG